jgi:Mn-dependent DtxR family transcriptional regulator
MSNLDKKISQSNGVRTGNNQKYSLNNSNNIISVDEKFIKKLFSELNGYIEIREIANGHAKTKYFKSVKDLINNYDPSIDKNIYIGMMTRNKKRGKLQDTLKTRALWLDFDDVESYIEVEYILNMNNLPQPSIVVNSGHGYHVYYILDKAAGREIEPVIKKLAYTTGADGKATDLARIMRVPGTLNVKKPYNPVKCEVMSMSKNTFKLDELAATLGVEAKAKEQPQREPEQAAEAFNLDYEGIISKAKKPCIKSMLQGVEEGERNFLLGRITKYLKNDLAISKKQAKKVVRVWNLKNEKPQPEGELIASFNDYWQVPYNLQGCKILDSDGNLIPDKQQILNKYCSKLECPLSAKIEFEQGQSVIEYNNRLLNEIKSVSAYSLIIYGMLTMNEQGLTAERGSEILGITEKTFRKHAEKLIKMKYAKVKKGIRQRGTSDVFYLTRQGTFKLGRSKISYAAIRLLNSELKQGLIKAADFKVYMLLRYYEYKSRTGEVYPATTTLAEKLGIDRSRVSKRIKRLEQRDFIEIDRDKRRSNTYIFKIR